MSESVIRFGFISYEALSREQMKALANGAGIAHNYDAAAREIVLEQTKASGAAVAVYTASYDGVGNRLSVAELDGSRVTYIYDVSYQLLSEECSGSTPFATSFTYDGLGNRLSQTKDGAVTAYTHNAIGQQTLLADHTGVTNYGYKAVGRQTSISPL